jgi:hypothetical protein
MWVAIEINSKIQGALVRPTWSEDAEHFVNKLLRRAIRTRGIRTTRIVGHTPAPSELEFQWPAPPHASWSKFMILNDTKKTQPRLQSHLAPVRPAATKELHDPVMPG